MRAKDIVIKKYYRHKDAGWYAQPIEILPPKTGINTNPFIIVKCRWMSHKDSGIGLIKYFRPRNLIRITETTG